MLAYDEIIDFIATAGPPDRLAAFRPSPEAQARVDELLQRNRTTGLTTDETKELDRYIELETITMLAKSRARKRARGE